MMLCDFGTVKDSTGRSRSMGTVACVGTIDFLPPESTSQAQWKGDLWGDIWALGKTVALVLVRDPTTLLGVAPEDLSKTILKLGRSGFIDGTPLELIAQACSLKKNARPMARVMSEMTKWPTLNNSRRLTFCII